MSRSVGAKRLDDKVSAGLDNLRYTKRRIFILSGRYRDDVNDSSENPRSDEFIRHVT